MLNDPEYLEELAREKLGMANKGDFIFTIMGAEKQP
jgi:cell division protein FtsB